MGLGPISRFPHNHIEVLDAELDAAENPMAEVFVGNYRQFRNWKQDTGGKHPGVATKM
jgi:hypothetical protein